MAWAIGIPCGLIAVGILLDIMLNDGEGTARIIRAFRGRP